MEKIKNYLKERKYFISNYEDFRKEIKVIIDAPSDEVPEETLKSAIYLLHKCEASIDKMNKLVEEMDGDEKLVLGKTIVEVQSRKDHFGVMKCIILALEEIVKS